MSSPRLFVGLALLAAACGKNTSLTDGPLGIDASTADAATANPDADPHGAVTVTLLSRDGIASPVVGAKVVFTDGDGTREKTTGDDGKATATVLPGATVTAVSAYQDTTRYVDSIGGVKPGDDLVIGGGAETPAIGTFTVDVGTLQTSELMTIYGPCGSGSAQGPQPALAGAGAGSGGQTITLSMFASCKQDTMDLVAVDERDGTIQGYAVQKGVAYSDGGSVSLTAQFAPIDSLDAPISNVPAEVTSVAINAYYPNANGYSTYNSLAPTDGKIGFALPITAASGGLVTTSSYDGANRVQSSYEQVAPGTTQYAVDLGARLLAWVDAPSVDAAAGKVAVKLTGTATGDLEHVRFLFRRNGVTYNWELWRAAAGDLALPTLPTDVTDHAPTADDLIEQPYAGLIDLPATVTYDQIRGRLGSAFDPYYSATAALPGVLRISASPYIGGGEKIHPSPSLAGPRRR